MHVQGPSTCQGACLKLFGRPCYLCWDNAQETESPEHCCSRPLPWTWATHSEHIHEGLKMLVASALLHAAL